MNKHSFSIENRKIFLNDDLKYLSQNFMFK